MTYKNQHRYTRLFTVLLIIAVFSEMGAVFFSFGVKSVFAATPTAKPLAPSAPKPGCLASNSIPGPKTAIKGECDKMCKAKDTYKWKGGVFAGTGKCCCTPKDPSAGAAENQCLGETRKCPGVVIRKDGKGQGCESPCKDTEIGGNPEYIKLCKLKDSDTQTICCCGRESKFNATAGDTPKTSSFVCTTKDKVTTCENPIKGVGGIEEIVSRLVHAALGIVGSLALFMFVWGGVLFLTAAGDDKRIKKGLDTLIWSAMGLILIFGAYVVAKFILDALAQSMKG